MANKHELKITIDNNGKVNIEVEGAKGSKCLDLTEDIEAALGEVLTREKKSEFYQENDSSEVSINTSFLKE